MNLLAKYMAHVLELDDCTFTGPISREVSEVEFTDEEWNILYSMATGLHKEYNEKKRAFTAVKS